MRRLAVRTKNGFVALVDHHLIFDEHAMPVEIDDIPRIKKRLVKYHILACCITPFQNTDFTKSQKIEICQLKRDVKCRNCLRYQRNECEYYR